MNARKTITRTFEQLRAADPLHSVWVMANAGSGKTHVLVDRVVRLLLKGFAPQSILCLTFTKAAAAEMSLRLFKLMSSWIALDDAELTTELRSLGAVDVAAMDLARARRLFATSIETPGGLKIQTIHAFCEKLLQLFPVESGLAPGFRVMDESDSKALLEEARLAAFGDAVAEADDALLLFEDGLVSSPDGFEALAKLFLPATSLFQKALDPALDEAALDAALRHATGLASTVEIEAEILALDRHAYGEAATALTGVAAHYKRDMGALLMALSQAVAFSDVEERLCGLLFTGTGEAGKQDHFSKATRQNFSAVCSWFDGEKVRLIDLLEKLALSRKVDATLSLLRLLRRVHGHFMQLKQESGLYDFDDLIKHTQALLQDSRAAQWVLYKLDTGLSHVLVDEAQDTSPAQWQIITALADEFFSGAGRPQRTPRTVFVVGDIKQSIYSFQGADTVAFSGARDHFRKRVDDSGAKLQEIDLTISYRSLPAVLKIVDVVFADDAPATKGLQQDEGKSRGHTAKRDDEGQGIFELWPPFTPVDTEEPDRWDAPVDRETENAPRQRLAIHLADVIKGWIGKRLLASRNRAVEPGDILILLQKRGTLFSSLIAELRQRGIAVAGADRLKLQESLAVKDLMALVQFCILPEDDLALACILKSPLITEPLNDEDLTAIANARKGSLWQALAASERHDGAVQQLQSWRQDAGEAGPHGFLARALTQARRAMVARLGVEAQDATDMLLDVALGYERDHGTSLAAFLHWFMAREEDVKRDLNAAGGQVRLMTVHGAKGLEANIVILPDATDVPGPRGGPALLAIPGGGNNDWTLPLFNAPTAVKPPAIRNWRDALQEKDRHERMRLLYVAMTRAKDELYVAGAMGENRLNENCWYALVKEALAQSPATDLRKVPGLHPDGDILRHGDEPQMLASPAKPGSSPSAMLPDWVTTPAPRDAALPRWQGVSGLVSASSQMFDRAAAERGLAIHRVLEVSHSGDSLEVVTRRVERQSLEPELAVALHAVLSSADTAPYFSAAAMAEAVIAGELPGLGKVRGRVDRLVIGKEAIWLVDFKSGRRPATPPRGYVVQMAIYSAVLAEAYPGRAIKAALLWTQDGALDWLENTTLSQSLDQLRQELPATMT